MTIIQAIILGFVQGLTEFLPISSSAHLVLIPYLFNWQIAEKEAFVFNVLVQLGTLVAVLLYYRKDLWVILSAMFKGIREKKPFHTHESLYGWYIILATIPAGLVGFLLKDQVEQVFSTPLIVAIMLLFTALLMVLSEKIGKKIRNTDDITKFDALIIGLFQVLAIFPGVSRSGSTISAGLLRNIKREDAARFSFLMSIPIMLAAGGLAFVDLFSLPSLGDILPVLIIGFLVAVIIGYLSIAWLIRFLSKKPLYYFSIYCFLVAIIILVFNYAK